MLFSKNDCALQLAFEPNFLEIEKAKAEQNIIYPWQKMLLNLVVQIATQSLRYLSYILYSEKLLRKVATASIYRISYSR